MLNLNQTILENVIAESLAKTSHDKRWTRAIERAAHELETNPYISEFEGGILIKSSQSEEIYTTGNECECTAWLFHKPCFHRAVFRLISRVREVEAIEASKKTNVVQMPAPKTSTLVGTFVRAVVPDAKDNTGWTVVEGIVSIVEHRKFYSVLTLRTGERFSSEYVARSNSEEMELAA